MQKGASLYFYISLENLTITDYQIINLMTKRISTALAILFAGSALIWAQDFAPSQNKKGKWGYVDDNGAVVIDFKYDEASAFVNGMAKVKKNDCYGFINASGKEVIPVKYNIIEPFSDNVLKVAEGGKVKDGQLSGEKYGFIDFQGNYLIKDLFNEVGPFNKGVARVMRNEQYGFINDKANLIVPCRFKAVGEFNDDGYVWVNEGCSIDKDGSTIKGGKFGIYNNAGKVIIEPKYKSAGQFTPYKYTYSDNELSNMGKIEKKIRLESGTHRFLRKTKCPTHLFEKMEGECYGFYGSNNSDGKKNSVVDRNGNILIPIDKYQGAFYPDDGFAPIVDKNGKWNYVNVTTGAQLIPTFANDCNSFVDGVAVVQTIDNQWRIIDTTGRFVGDSYDYIYPRHEDVYIVKKNDKYGVLSASGQVIKAPTNYFVYPMNDGLMAIKETSESGVGYITADGTYKIQPKYYSGFSFKNGIAAVKSKNGWGYIDTDDKTFVECKWADIFIIKSADQSITWVKETSASDWRALDIKSGTFAFEGSYKQVEAFGNKFKDIAIVGESKEKMGAINTKGNIIIPIEFDSYELAAEACQVMLDRNIKQWKPVDTFRLKLWHNDGRNKNKLSDKIADYWWDY